MSHVIAASNLVVRTPLGPRAIDDFALRRGELGLITGGTGSGKTALLNFVATGLGRLAGSLCALGGGAAQKQFEHGWRRGVAIVPQHQLVFSDLTVEENLRVGWDVGGSASRWLARLDACCKASDSLRPLLRRRADNLSGGERRMVAIMRAFASEPSLVLLDEPLTGLDAARQRWLWTLLESWRGTGVAALVALQDDVGESCLASCRLRLRPPSS